MFVTDLSHVHQPIVITTDAPPTSPARAYLTALPSPNSRRTMLTQLNKVAVIMGYADCFVVPWHELRAHHLLAIRAHFTGQAKATTVGVILSAVRGVMKTCWQMELIDGETLARIQDVENLKDESVDQAAIGRMLHEQELRRLVEICEADPKHDLGRRDAAMFAVAYSGGLRRAEIVRLNRSDVTLTPRGNYQVIATGKREKTRSFYVAGNNIALLRDYLDWRDQHYAADQALFVRLAKGGYPAKDASDVRLTDQAIYKVCKARATQAGIADFSPHDLRRSTTSQLIEAGVDLVQVAKILGHRNINTTARYDRRNERSKELVAVKLSF